MKLFTIISLATAGLFSQCQERQTANEQNPEMVIEKVSFGTSFGMCVGYCTQELTITQKLASKTITPRVDDNLTEKRCSKTYRLADLTEKIDMTSFTSLPATIGCPDCADGGAEWVEITSKAWTRKVTYEFRKEPIEIQSFIEDLRLLYDELGECN